MKHRYHIALTSIALSLGLSACQVTTTPNPATDKPAQQSLNMKPAPVISQKMPHTARIGDMFMIELESNPSTGIQWHMAEPFDNEHLSIVNSEFVAPNNQMPKVGAPGKQIWLIKATRPGQTIITLSRVASWDKNAAVELANFTVHIKP